MKDASGRVIGFEKLNCSIPQSDSWQVAVETVPVSDRTIGGWPRTAMADATEERAALDRDFDLFDFDRQRQALFPPDHQAFANGSAHVSGAAVLVGP